MIQFRRLSLLLLGAWLGASVVADVAVTQSFQTVDRFLASPGDTTTPAQLDAIGRDRERVILRRNAAEENNWIFNNWERAEFALGAGLVLLLISGDRTDKLLLTGSIALIVILVAEHFFLTPRIVDMGRFIDDIPKTDDRYKTFWMFHGFYSGLDILKMLITFAMAAGLVWRPKADSPVAAREYSLAGAGRSAVPEGKR